MKLIRTITIFVALLAVAFLAAIALIPSDFITEGFETCRDARSKGHFDRGWMPDVFPEICGPIVSAHDLDSNLHCSSAAFPRESIAAVRAAATRKGLIDFRGDLQEPPFYARYCGFSLDDVARDASQFRRDAGLSIPAIRFEYAVILDEGRFLYWSGR